MKITVRLADSHSLDELLAGPYASRLWLTSNDDGTYLLHAGVPGDASTEAILRVISGEGYEHEGGGALPPDGPPPLDETDEVAELRESWIGLFKTLPEPPTA